MSFQIDTNIQTLKNFIPVIINEPSGCITEITFRSAFILLMTYSMALRY